jgi:uncharacterized protein
VQGATKALIAIRFGEPSRQLFGLYQPAAGDEKRNHCVLLCNPFGQEAIRCHRLFRVLGDRLARSGFDVFRFDYFATGDSDGDDVEGDVDVWVEDVKRANEEVLRLSGHGGCSWFGLRLGATMAALASINVSPPPKRLVLWDPVIDGTAYLSELARAHRAELKFLHGTSINKPARRLADESGADTTSEALGFPLPTKLRDQIQVLSIAKFDVNPASGLSVISSTESREFEALVPNLEQRAAGVRMIKLSTRIVWASDEAMNTAIVPTEALHSIAEALSTQQ